MSSNKISQAIADHGPHFDKYSADGTTDQKRPGSGSDDDVERGLKGLSIGPHIPSGGQNVYYIIDAQSLQSGKSVITIKDRTADPAPLGLLGFGLTTFLLNLHNAGVYPMNTMILAMGLCYGGSAQVIAGIFEFTKGNMFPMVAFMSYGFFWISLVVLLVFPKLGYAAAPDHMSMALYLFIWGVFSFIMFVGTILHKRPMMLSIVFFTVVVLFSLLAAFHWSLDEKVEKAAGIEGIICGLSAIYMAAAIMWNSWAGRTILWVGNRE